VQFKLKAPMHFASIPTPMPIDFESHSLVTVECLSITFHEKNAANPMRFLLQPCTPDFSRTAPFYFEHDFCVRLPPEIVFDFIAQGSDETWFPNFKSCRWISAEREGVGSIREFRLSYMRLLEHFSVWQRGERLAFWVSECSLPLMTKFMEDYRFERLADGSTRLLWRSCYTPNPWIRFLHPLLRPFFARDFRKAAVNLSQVLERLARERDVPK
jgi:hypothetical protein